MAENILNKKESQTVEFKQLWKDEYLKTICAFANSNGAALYWSFTPFEEKRNDTYYLFKKEKQKC